MNPFYKQPVVIFGFAAPVLGVLLLFGAAFHYKGKLEDTYAARKAGYTKFQKDQKVREGLEATVSSQRPTMKKWMGLFDVPTASKVNAILGEVQKRYPGEQLQQTSFSRSNNSGGIGGASAQSAIELRLKFRGTFRGLQNAFLELETRMPNLQLDSIKLKQEANRNLLAADLVYTAWEKE